MRLLLSQWSSSDMNFQPLGWLNTTCTIVTCSGLWLWDLWDIYEWYCYFIAKLYWEAWGLFWKRSVSLFLRGVLFFVCCLLVFWLGCLVFVLVVCLCWLLLFGWKGDTLGIVSLYSHAWEWTISTKGLMTVRASSAHGTSKKKITGLDMCKVCTEAVHSVALWTRVTLQVWTCVKYVPKQSIP